MLSDGNRPQDEPSNKLRNLFRFFLWHIKRSRQLFSFPFEIVIVITVEEQQQLAQLFWFGCCQQPTRSPSSLRESKHGERVWLVVSIHVQRFWRRAGRDTVVKISFFYWPSDFFFYLLLLLLFSLYKAKTSFIIIWRCSSTYLVRRRATITTTTTTTAGYRITRPMERRRTPTKPTNRTICNKNSLS